MHRSPTPRPTLSMPPTIRLVRAVDGGGFGGACKCGGFGRCA